MIVARPAALVVLLSPVLLTASVLGQSSCPSEGAVELQGFSSSHAGIVVVCVDGEWGTVSTGSHSTLWSEKNAQVVCRSLGFSGAVTSILQKTIPGQDSLPEMGMMPGYPIHYSQVQCNGTERSLSGCPHSTDTAGSDHLMDAAVTCRSTSDASPSAGDVRLLGDVRNGVGAVEYYDPQVGGWTAVCADSTHSSSWNSNTDAASIVCRQLGYEGGTPFSQSIPEAFVSNRGVSDLLCSPSANFSLAQCDYSKTSCQSDQVGWVRCKEVSDDDGTTRLVGGSAREGLLQVAYGGRWGTICSSGWNTADVEVACKELGIESGDGVSISPKGSYSQYESDLQPVWLTGVSCSSWDTGIYNCPSSDSYPIGYNPCSSGGSYAMINCGTRTPPLGSSGGSGLGTGQIIAIVVAVVIGFLFILCCCSWWARRRYRNHSYTHLRSPGQTVHTHAYVQGTGCGAMQYPRAPPTASCCGPPPPPPPSSCCGGNQPPRAGVPYGAPYPTNPPPPYAPAPAYPPTAAYPPATYSVPEEQQHLVFNPDPYPPPSAPPPGYPPQN